MLQECACDCQNHPRAKHDAAEKHPRQHQQDGWHHPLYAAGRCQVLQYLIIHASRRPNAESLQHLRHLTERAPLKHKHPHASCKRREHQSGAGRDLESEKRQREQRNHERPCAYVVDAFQAAYKRLGVLLGSRGSGKQAHCGKHCKRDAECRQRRAHHVAYVAEKIHSAGRCGQHRGVAQRRHLVAEISPRDNRSGNQRRVISHGIADTDES